MTYLRALLVSLSAAHFVGSATVPKRVGTAQHPQSATDSAIFVAVLGELKAMQPGKLIVNPAPLDTALDIVIADRGSYTVSAETVTNLRRKVLRGAGIEMTDDVSTLGCPSALLPYASLDLSKCPSSTETLVAISLPRDGSAHGAPITQDAKLERIRRPVAVRAILARRTKHGAALEVYDFTARDDGGGSWKIVSKTPVTTIH